MRNILVLADKEIREGLRNRWVLATTLLLAALALTLTFLGSAPTGSVGASRLDVVIVSLASLTIFLIPLIALLISHDAIVGEMERGTMLLLLSYPVSRVQVIIGKYIGHFAILTIATIIGYGIAAIALLVSGGAAGWASWMNFGGMVLSSILLGMVFVAIGYLISTLVRERSTAGGIAIGVWLFFVLIYDMAFLGVLVALQGHSLPSSVLNTFILLNPTDIYRLINLGSVEARAVSGMGGVAENAGLGAVNLALSMLFWIIVPLAMAAYRFSRREL